MRFSNKVCLSVGRSVCLLVIKLMPFEPGRIAQSVMCLATDASLTADSGVASSIPAQCNRPEFPPSQFFPGERMGPPIVSPGKK